MRMSNLRGSVVRSLSTLVAGSSSIELTNVRSTICSKHLTQIFVAMKAGRLVIRSGPTADGGLLCALSPNLKMFPQSSRN